MLVTLGQGHGATEARQILSYAAKSWDLFIQSIQNLLVPPPTPQTPTPLLILVDFYWKRFGGKNGLFWHFSLLFCSKTLLSGKAGVLFPLSLCSFMVCANNQIRYDPVIVFVCLHITLLDYRHYVDASESIDILKRFSGWFQGQIIAVCQEWESRLAWNKRDVSRQDIGPTMWPWAMTWP